MAVTFITGSTTFMSASSKSFPSMISFFSSSGSDGGGGGGNTTQYLMRATRTYGIGPTIETVYWQTVSGSIDSTGAQSQYPTNELSLIKLVKVII